MQDKDSNLEAYKQKLFWKKNEEKMVGNMSNQKASKGINCF